MKKFLSLLLAAAVLAATMTAAFAAEPSYEGKTVILYTGNVRGDVDVYPKIKAAKDAYEAAGAEVVLVDAGNYLQGTAAANTDRGLSVYNLMDAAGYDVAAMGLAEFGYTDATTGYLYHGNYTRYYTQAELQDGTEAVTYSQNRDGSVTADRPDKKAASFQTVASNVTASGVYSFASYSVVALESGMTLFFYGLTDPAAAQNIQDGYVSVSAPAFPEFVTPDADVVVCLSNAGVTAGDYGDILIDVPVGAGFTVGAYVIDNETGAVATEAVTLSGEDAAVAALAAAVKAAAGEVVGVSEVILNGADSVSRNQESNLGDLVGDALVWYAQNYIDGIDSSLPVVAIQNGGNCDNFVYTGEITETDLLRALPFSPMGIGVLYVTGEQLLETLEAASQSENCPGFAQVSGLTYTLDTGAEYDGGAAYGSYFEADSINRVTITSVNDQDFDPEAVYALVCDNYLFNGSDTYYTLKAAKEAEGAVYINNGSGVKVRDAVALYIQKELGGVIGSGYAAAQGRITVVRSAFSDVKAGDACYNAVLWAVEHSVTTGTAAGKFSPDAVCTRAEAVTFLWRAAGSPEPETESSPFNDVFPSDYYYQAALWAAEQGITGGTGGRSFSPGRACTRAEAAVFLWRYAGEPEAENVGLFADVTEVSYYSAAVNWAAEQGIADGADTFFHPGGGCPRGQIVTFMYRWLVQ